MEDGDPPFYWQPPSTAVYNRRRPPSPPLLNSSLVIVLVPCLAILFVFFVVHSFNYRSHTQYNPYNHPVYPYPIPNPAPPPKPAYSFRRSWDSLNVVLIVAAILCGVFARRNEDVHTPPAAAPDSQNDNFVVLRRNDSDDYGKQNQFSVSGFQQQEQLQQQQWLQFADNQRMYGFSPRRRIGSAQQPEIGGGRLRRTSSAYPDFMRQEASLWEESISADRRLRFFDDFEINRFYPPAETNYARHQEKQVTAAASVESGTGAGCAMEIREIPVDTFVQNREDSAVKASGSSSPPPTDPRPPMSPAPPPPPPPPPVSLSKPKRVYQSVPRKEEVERSAPPPPAPPQPPPPPPPPPAPLQQEKKLKRRKSNTTKEIANALASLYTNRKRKRKQQKSNKQDSHDSSESATQQRFPPPSPPPPPPPPPPPSVFHSFFRKSIKHKKIHSISSAPPPPPPPPPPTAPSSRSSKRKSQIPAKPTSQPPPEPPISNPPSRRHTTTSTFTAKKPPLPARPSRYYDGDESPLVNSGSQSPLIPIPPPPPPPPFRIPEMKFSVLRGGAFVRIRSAESSRAGSPELEEEVDPTTTANEDVSAPSDAAEINGRDDDGPSPALCCPSPDVNAKADTFIARHHKGWRLEKLNSWREKRTHNLGPGTGP